MAAQEDQQALSLLESLIEFEPYEEPKKIPFAEPDPSTNPSLYINQTLTPIQNQDLNPEKNNQNLTKKEQNQEKGIHDPSKIIDEIDLEIPVTFDNQNKITSDTRLAEIPPEKNSSETESNRIKYLLSETKVIPPPKRGLIIGTGNKDLISKQILNSKLEDPDELIPKLEELKALKASYESRSKEITDLTASIQDAKSKESKLNSQIMTLKTQFLSANHRLHLLEQMDSDMENSSLLPKEEERLANNVRVFRIRKRTKRNMSSSGSSSSLVLNPRLENEFLVGSKNRNDGDFEGKKEVELESKPVDARPKSLSNESNVAQEFSFWCPDAAVNNCAGCGTRFWFLNRKHHCRECGEVFCSTCSNYEKVLSNKFPYGLRGVRVCYKCYGDGPNTVSFWPCLAPRKALHQSRS